MNTALPTQTTGQSRRRATLTFAILSVLLVTLSAANLLTGDSGLPATALIGAMTGGSDHTGYAGAILSLRITRIAVAATVGAALSVGGLLMQTMFRNPLADPYILGVSSGASLGAAVLMLDIDSSYLMLALGILLIFLSASFFILSDRIHFQPNAIAGVAMGVVSGISNGFFGIGGPPIALYFAPSIPDKTEYNATVQAFFSIVNTFILAVRLARGSFSMVSPSLVLVGIIALIPSSLVAMSFFRHINADALRRIIYAFVGVNGLIIAIREIAAL